MLKTLFEKFRVIALALLGAAIILVIRATIRIKRRGASLDSWAGDLPGILTFWHGHQLMMAWSFLNSPSRRKDNRLSALISQHSDGRIIAKIMEFLGISSIAGSSSKGGREALFAMLRELKRGGHIAITPDGPKGPVYQVKEGVIRLAQLSGCKIYPAVFAADKYWQFKSWDKMILPKPFARAVLQMGNPIEVPKNLTQEEVKEFAIKVRDVLNELDNDARKSLEVI